MASLLPQLFLDSGAGLTPSDGALLHFNVVGSGTDKNTYTTAAATVANANPVVADSKGVFPPIYITGSYDWVLQNKNAVQQNTGTVSSNEAGQTDFTNTGSTVVTTVDARLKETAREFATIAAMTADTDAGVGQLLMCEDYAAGSDAGVMYFRAVTAATGTADGGSYIDHDSLAVQFERIFNEKVYANDFGAVGDGSTNNSAAIAAGNVFVQARLGTLWFRPNKDYAYSTQIALTGNAMSFAGDPYGPWQSGSTLPSVTLTWTGGATPSMTCDASNIAFVGMAIQNKGTATDFIEFTSGAIRYWFHRVSFLQGTGTTNFTRSVIRSSGNRLGYSKFTAIQCGGVAPKFIDIDGESTANGITPIYIGDRCIFESGVSQALTVVYIKDETLDALIIENCTFNHQGAELTVVDTTDSPLTDTIRNFVFENNEWDYNLANASTDRMLKLTNVNSAHINSNDLQMGGTATHLITLVNTRITSFNGNSGKSIATAVIEADSTSRVNPGLNSFNKGNVAKLVDDDVEGLLINLAWSAGNVFMLGEEAPANVNTLQVIEPTDASGWTLTFRHGSQGFFVPGQMVTVQVKNASGGVVAAGTLTGSIKSAGSLVAPANGFSRFYTFVRTVGGFMEISRSAADVANI